MALPDVVEVHQSFPRPRVGDVASAVQAQWREDGIGSSVRAGMDVAVAVGSRGVAEIPAFVAAGGPAGPQAGAPPFVVPAAGQPRGAAARGPDRDPGGPGGPPGG